MTKKKVLIGSLIGIATGFILLSIKNFMFCRSVMYRGYSAANCAIATQTDITAFIEFISVPLFVGTVLLYFMHDEVFNLWFKFARAWLLLGAIVTFFSSSTNGGILGSDKFLFSELFLVIFLIVSFILIAYKLIRNYYYKKSK